MKDGNNKFLTILLNGYSAVGKHRKFKNKIEKR